MSFPTFAVVGHPNKGKSSIVSTLVEDASVVVSPLPRTTRESRAFDYRLGGKTLFRLVDTPGFQRAHAVLAWLEAHASSAEDRPRAVAAFVDEHGGDERFVDECELLKPLVDGAAILYVVDGSVPYGSEYEAEMEILRWTGRPRMALINTIGADDFIEVWRRALDQYFSIVRVFDAVHADVEKRTEVFAAFGALDPAWQASADRINSAMLEERVRRRRAAAGVIVDFLGVAMNATVERTVPSDQSIDSSRLTAELESRIERDEERAQARIAEIFGFRDLVVEGRREIEIGESLFAERTWQMFGLSKSQLAATAAAGGALIGGSFDLALGGATALLGSGIGAAIGAASAWFGSQRAAERRLFDGHVGARIKVGPIREPNFPWVLLGRAWFHYQLVAERNHARRDALRLVLGSGQWMENLKAAERRELAREFVRLRRGGDRSRAVRLVADLLNQPIDTRSR